MYKSIVAPVDLAHLDTLESALNVAADLARHYDARLCFVGVTAAAPSALAHTPKEYAAKLEEFAQAQADRHGIATSSHAEVAHDPKIEIDHAVVTAAEAEGADLIVMASHVPGIADKVWPSNGGRVAAHARISVLLVRP